MQIKDKIEFIRQKTILANPDIVKLKFGCEIEKLFWYKTEADKKKNNIDWIETGHFINGRSGVIVKDLRSEWLPMWVDDGDQMEFNVEPSDIVSFEIIGRKIGIAEILVAMNKKGERIGVSSDGTFIGLTNGDMGYQWNLKNDNLENQSEETLSFIANLL